MNPVHSSQAAAAAAAPALQTNVANKNGELQTTNAASVHGYGLPCLKCRTYYDSTLSACPVCNESKRVAVNAISVRTTSPEAKDSATLEEQRRRFAQELNPPSYNSTLQIPVEPISLCLLTENHTDEPGAAKVCQSCYSTLQNRADLMEAALHIDLKEAAHVVYEAVWADPSDPTKTYQNAAQALLTELHKRAGISAVIGPIHPMAH